MLTSFRVVVDTNILLRGLLNTRSAAGRVVCTCDERVVLLLLSKRVLSEYRSVLTDPAIIERYPELSSEKVDIAIRRLRYVADVMPFVSAEFSYPRDPKDEMLIELAISGRATHIITADKDLLSLVTGHGDAARRFRQRVPSTRVVDAAAFLADLDAELNEA